MTEKRVGPGSNPDMASMPRPALPGAPPDQPNAGMPAPGMPGAAREQVPSPAMPAESGAGLARFPPPLHGAIAPRYEPGVVEVQFREGLMPRVIPGGPGQPPSLAAGRPLDDVNHLLRRYQAIGAEPTFGPGEQGDSPYRRDFVTLRFPADADVVEIARQLNRLDDVEYAAPVPSALPPASPMPPPPRR